MPELNGVSDKILAHCVMACVLWCNIYHIFSNKPLEDCSFSELLNWGLIKTGWGRHYDRLGAPKTFNHCAWLQPQNCLKDYNLVKIVIYDLISEMKSAVECLINKIHNMMYTTTSGYIALTFYIEKYTNSIEEK